MGPMPAVFVFGALALVAAKPPNIIFFLTDDQDVEMASLAYMPTVQRELMQKGATFTRFYAHVPVCCPSRSSLISGQYMHNNGCSGNGIPTNCSSPEFQNGPEARSYTTYLAAAGYKTSFAGKYLNDYGDPGAGGLAHIPPGWTNWQGLKGNSVYYNYSLSNNGVVEHHGTDYATDYLPNVIRNKTLDFLRANLGGAAPVYAVLSTPSCHGPQDAAPQYQGAFPGARAPRLPNYNATVAGAPVHWLQASHGAYTFHEDAEAFADLVFRRRLQTLLTVDDILADVVAAVDAAGELDNTYFVYTADNGYHTGQFGLVYDKRNPFEADTHLPMLIRGPGVAPGLAVGAPFSMVDLSATLLDMAGVSPPPQFDGATMLPFARPAPPQPRLATLIEYVGEGGDGGPARLCPATTGKKNIMCNPAGNYSIPPFFFGEDFCLCQDAFNNTYSCLRFVGGAHADAEKAQMLSPGAVPHAPPANVDFRYCEFKDEVATVEFFDLATDPYELNNTAASLEPAVKAKLSARLAAARACKGAAACDAVLSAPL